MGTQTDVQRVKLYSLLHLHFLGGGVGDKNIYKNVICLFGALRLMVICYVLYITPVKTRSGSLFFFSKKYGYFSNFSVITCSEYSFEAPC